MPLFVHDKDILVYDKYWFSYLLWNVRVTEPLNIVKYCVLRAYFNSSVSVRDLHSMHAKPDRAT